MQVKAGTRMQCGSCGSQVIIVKPGEPELECCGRPLEPLSAPGGKAAEAKPTG